MAKKLPRYKLFHLFTKFSMQLITDLENWNLMCEQNDYQNFICDDGAIGRCAIDPKPSGVVLMMYIPFKHYHYGTVIHESTHMVDYLMEHLGINDIEFRAYMIEDLSVRLIEYFRKEQDGNLCKKSD